MKLRHLPLVAALAVTSLLAAGCTSIGGKDEVVRVYSARHYDLEPAFEKFYKDTGIKVEFLYGTDAELRERIKAEGKDTLADVYMTVDAGNLAIAAEDGMFQPLHSKVLDDAVPKNFRDPEDRWFGLSERVRTIIYNPDKVKPSELSTYEELADPKWKGRLCLRRSTNVYTQSLVASLIARDGEQKATETVKGWADNAADIFNNDVEIVNNVGSGRCDVGIVNHYYLARVMQENPDINVKLFWANQSTSGVHVNISGAGVTKNADDPELAQKLLEWLATDGQEAFVNGNNEYPVNPKVKPEQLLAGFGEFKADSLDAATFGGLNAEAIKVMAKAGYE
jgi:iron(III) transport system substrate-binding protein